MSINLEDIPIVEAIIDEIFEDSVLRYYDQRKPQETLFEVVQITGEERDYHIIQPQINEVTGELLNRPVKKVRDQVEAMKLLSRYFANFPLGVIVQMDILNPVRV